MDQIRLWFDQENARWERILHSPQAVEQLASQRIDSDKCFLVTRLTPRNAEALRNVQTAEAIRLQQQYQNIRNLESAIAAKRRASAIKRDVNVISRLMGHRKPKLTRTAEKLAAVVDRRSVREMQNLLFKIKRDYRAAHKRYSQIHGFHSYGNRSTLTHNHRQQGVKL